MPRILFAFIFLLMGFLQAPQGFCQEEKCVNAEGEAAIIHDIPSAKTEAIARAKWAAIEQAIGIEISTESFVQNFTLVEDIIKTQVNGIVTRFDILSQQTKEDIVAVKIKACVLPAKAREAVSSLALNNSIAVFIPARKPNAGGGRDEYEETNILSETLIEKLTDQDYTVVDVAPTQTIDAVEIEKAVKSGSTLAIRSMVYKFLSNVIIIGKIDYTISTKKGEDIGYGLSMPFQNVTVRLTYRIAARNNKTGIMEVLTAGTEQGKGMANNVEDATAEGLKEMVEIVAPKILDKIGQYVQGNVRKITLKVNGVTNLDTNMDVRELLQGIVWVMDIEEKHLGEFVVSYPENPVYLANSLTQQGHFSVVNFSPYSIIVDYKK